MVRLSLRSSRLKENESSEPSGRSQLQEGLWGLPRRVRADLALTSTLPRWHVPSPWMKGQIPSIEGAAYFLVFLFFFFPENGYHLRLHAARFNQIFMTGRTSLIALSVPACPAWYWKVLPAWWSPPCPCPSPTPPSPWVTPGPTHSSPSWLDLELVWDGLCLMGLPSWHWW